MEERNEMQDVKNRDRRRFMEISAKFGFTAAVVALGNEHFLVTATGKEWETDWVQVFEVENGLIIRFREYTDTAQISSAYES